MEKIVNTEYITRTKITASDGMVLTNGTNYGKIIFLSETESPFQYYEIPESEYQEILEEKEKDNHGA